MGTHGIRIVLWVWASILITLGVSGFATRADLQPSSSIENPPRPSLTTAPPESSQSPPPTPVARVARAPSPPPPPPPATYPTAAAPTRSRAGPPPDRPPLREVGRHFAPKQKPAHEA